MCGRILCIGQEICVPSQASGTQCIDYHLEKDEFEVVGKLAPVCAQIV